MKKAKDLMTKNPKTFQSGQYVREAMSTFLEMDIYSSPVLTPMGETIGLLTEISLVRAAVRFLYSDTSNDKIIHHTEILEKPSFIDEDAPLEDVIKALVKAPSHRLLVINKQNRLIGIVSPKDILRAFTGERNQTAHLRAELETVREEAAKLAKELDFVKISLQRYQTLFKSTPNMMHGADSKGKIVLANTRLHDGLGYEDGDLLGKSIVDIYPKSVHHEALAGLEKIKATGEHHAVYTTMLKSDGTKIRVEVVSSALLDEAGNFICTISVSREINSEALLRALHGVIETGETS